MAYATGTIEDLRLEPRLVPLPIPVTLQAMRSPSELPTISVCVGSHLGSATVARSKHLAVHGVTAYHEVVPIHSNEGGINTHTIFYMTGDEGFSFLHLIRTAGAHGEAIAGMLEQLYDQASHVRGKAIALAEEEIMVPANSPVFEVLNNYFDTTNGITHP